MNPKIAVPLFASGYAVLRYGIVKGEPLENWPSFIGGKAMAIAAVLFLVLGIFQRTRVLERAREYFRLAFLFGLAHGIVSLGILNAVYYRYLHIPDVGRLNAFGELTVLFGALGLSLFFLELQKGRRDAQGSDLPLLLLLATHVFSVGVLKWLDLSRWAYGLAPISLLGFLVLVAGMLITVRGRVPAQVAE